MPQESHHFISFKMFESIDGEINATLSYIHGPTNVNASNRTSDFSHYRGKCHVFLRLFLNVRIIFMLSTNDT